VDTGADPITLSHPKQTFTLTTDLATPVKIYGHYLTRGEVVVWAERGTDDHGKPRPLSIAHSRIEVTPTFIERR
jgi:hypothetical protein